MYEAQQIAHLAFQQIKDFAIEARQIPNRFSKTLRASCAGASELAFAVRRAHKCSAIVFNVDHAAFNLLRMRIPDRDCTRFDKGECIILPQDEYERAVLAAIGVVERDRAKLKKRGLI